MDKVIVLNKLKQILTDEKGFKPIITGTGEVILSQAQIDKRVSDVQTIITIMERC